MSEEPQTQTSPWLELERLVELGDASGAEAFLESLPSGETAHTISRMEDSKQIKLLKLLPVEVAADLIEILSDVQSADLIEKLPFKLAASIVDQMVSDEQADLLAELSQGDAEAIIEQMSPEEAADVRRLSKYEPDTAGGIMITEFLAYPEHLKIDDVVWDLRRNAKKYAAYDVQYVYVVSSDNQRLRGTVRLRDLVLTSGSSRITSIMFTDMHSVEVSANLDQLEDFFDRHDFFGAPVVDELGRLVGVVRRAFVEEALAERADKAMLRIGGIIGGEELRTMPMASRATRRLAFSGAQYRAEPDCRECNRFL